MLDGDWSSDVCSSDLLKLLATLRPMVDRFFDEVLVMAEQEEVRRNRLSLLLNCVDLYLSVADFSKIVREGEETK
jgi:glycyl-tRNA synthetase beta chain